MQGLKFFLDFCNIAAKTFLYFEVFLYFFFHPFEFSHTRLLYIRVSLYKAVTPSLSQVMYEHLGSLLGTLVTLDEVVLNNAVLHEHWGAYRRLVRSAGSDQLKFGHDKAALQPLEKLLADVEATVMQGTMFVVREIERDSKMCVVMERERERQRYACDQAEGERQTVPKMKRQRKKGRDKN